MQDKISNEPGSNVIKIQGLNFSPRELDVMACIMNGRTSKKAIASTLQINPGTAAAHTRNIMQKLNCSSWEHIRDFIEQSEQAGFVQQHLKRVLARERFDWLLHQLADQLIGVEKPLCLIVYEAAESDAFLPIVHKIEETLKRIGITVQRTVAQNMFSIPSTSNVRILRLSQQRTGADVFTIADYPTSEALMVKVLETVVGEGALKDSFDGCVPSLSSETCSDRTSQSFFSKLFQRLRHCVATIKRYNNSTIAATAVSFLGVIGFVLWGVLSFTSPKTIRSDLTLPPSQVCLKRSELVDTIQRQLKSQQANSIPIVTLVGLGGVGKTIITPENQTSRQRRCCVRGQGIFILFLRALSMKMHISHLNKTHVAPKLSFPCL